MEPKMVAEKKANKVVLLCHLCTSSLHFVECHRIPPSVTHFEIAGRVPTP